jgi:hypothetical protein
LETHREENVVEDELETILTPLKQLSLVGIQWLGRYFVWLLAVFRYRDSETVEHGLNGHTLSCVHACRDEVFGRLVRFVQLLRVEALRQENETAVPFLERLTRVNALRYRVPEVCVDLMAERGGVGRAVGEGGVEVFYGAEARVYLFHTHEGYEPHDEV